MALLENDFSAGTDGVTLTQGSGGNTGGASGDYFDVATKAADGILAFEADLALMEGTCCQIATRATAQSAYLAWTTQYVDQANDPGRIYFVMDDLPASDHWFVQFLSATPTNQGGIQLLANGKLRVFDAIGAASTDSTATLSPDTLYRIEMKWTKTTSLVVKVYEGHSTTELDSITRALTGTADIGEIRYGVLSAFANQPSSTGSYYLKWLVSGDADFPGPAVTAQYARPEADVSLGNWTDEADGTTDIYVSIDEATASDSDYVKSGLSPASADVLKVRLGALTDPAASTGHIVRYRYKKDTTGGDQIDLTVKLLAADGSTLIASQAHTNIDAVTDGSFTLTGTEADAIPGADYATGLVLSFEAVAP